MASTAWGLVRASHVHGACRAGADRAIRGVSCRSPSLGCGSDLLNQSRRLPRVCLGVLSNLFLDPDTGLRLKSMRGKRAPQFLFAGELVALARARPSYLTMGFDQSHPRGGTR